MTTAPSWFRPAGAALAGAIATAFGLLPGCATAADDADAPVAATDVTIVASDYEFALPARLAEGRIDLELDNVGFEPHQAQLFRLRDGVDYGDVDDALDDDDIGPLMNLVDWVGGVNATEAGMAERVIADLEPGRYLVGCFYPSPDGTRHSRKGMVARFEVVGDDRPATTPTAPEPAASEGVITLDDFSIEMPAVLPAGPQRLDVANRGEAPHEVVFLRLAEERTPDEAIEFIRSFGTEQTVFDLPLAAPFRNAGGVVGLDQGRASTAYFRGEPGRYVAFCGIPFPGEGQLHYDAGMITTFEVAGGPPPTDQATDQSTTEEEGR